MDEVIEQLIRDLTTLDDRESELEDARNVYCDVVCLKEGKIDHVRHTMTIKKQAGNAAHARRKREVALLAVAKTAGKIASLWLLEKERIEKEQRRCKMEKIIVEGLAGKLATLGVARHRLEDAEDHLDSVEHAYRFAITIIENAMEADPLVAVAREKLKTMQQIEEDATRIVSGAAIHAWQQGLTDGKKEWRHGGWEIRLRTTLTPVVVEIESFVAHLERINAVGSLIKKLILNRKATTDLDSAVGPLTGLEIEEKTTCSAKCVSE